MSNDLKEISSIQSTIYDLIKNETDDFEEIETKGINISIEEIYDGPLDALYSLVVKRKIEIEDIPICEVINQIIDYLSNNKDVELSGDMITLATKLLYLKSSRILKNHRQLEELALQEEEIANELKLKLEEYAKYKEASFLIMDRMDFVNKSYFKNAPEIVVNEVFSTENLNKEDIHQALLRMSELEVEKIKSGLFSKVSDEKLKKIYKTNFIRVEDQIEKLQEKLVEKDNIKISEYIKNHSKSEKIATFLAVLEMCKAKTIYAEQASVYDDIYIKRRYDNELNYELIEGGI